MVWCPETEALNDNLQGVLMSTSPCVGFPASTKCPTSEKTHKLNFISMFHMMYYGLGLVRTCLTPNIRFSDQLEIK